MSTISKSGFNFNRSYLRNINSLALINGCDQSPIQKLKFPINKICFRCNVKCEAPLEDNNVSTSFLCALTSRLPSIM